MAYTCPIRHSSQTAPCKSSSRINCNLAMLQQWQHLSHPCHNGTRRRLAKSACHAVHEWRAWRMQMWRKDRRHTHDSALIMAMHWPIQRQSAMHGMQCMQPIHLRCCDASSRTPRLCTMHGQDVMPQLYWSLGQKNRCIWGTSAGAHW